MKYNRDVYKSLMMITQLGISMMTPIFLCVLLGIFLDKKFGTSLTVILLFIGMLAGGRNTYMLAMKFVDKTEKESEDEKHK